MGLACFAPSPMVCASSSRDRLFARGIVPLILDARVKDASVTRFFQRGMNLPLGIRGFQALKQISARKLYREEWLELEIPLKRNQGRNSVPCNPLIPNVFRGSESGKWFARTPERDIPGQIARELRRAYGKETGFDHLMRQLDWQESGLSGLAKIIEAWLPQHFPPLLIGYVESRPFNFATPRSIDLTAVRPSSKRRRPFPPCCNRQYPVFYVVKSAIAAGIRQSKKDTFERWCVALERRIPQIEDWEDHLLCRCLLEYLHQSKGKRGLNAKIFTSQVCEIASIHRMVKAGKPLGVIKGRSFAALKIYAKAKGVAEESLGITLKKDRQPPRDCNLVPASAVRDQCQPEPPPEIPGVGASEVELHQYVIVSARRVIINILLEFGARSSSLMEIELQDIIFGGPFIDIVVPSSKGRRCRNCSLPVTFLWREAEIRHLREFMGWIREAGWYHPQRRLTELAGFGKATNKAKGEAVTRKLRGYLNEMKVDFATHLPRILFATWFPIRCLVAHRRWLMKEKALECCRNDPWFTDEALDRLKMLYSSERQSTVEIGRRILMQANCHQFATGYCRVTPLLLKLWADPRMRPAMSPEIQRMTPMLA